MKVVTCLQHDPSSEKDEISAASDICGLGGVLCDYLVFDRTPLLELFILVRHPSSCSQAISDTYCEGNKSDNTKAHHPVHQIFY
jgi:hypothetical protein